MRTIMEIIAHCERMARQNRTGEYGKEQQQIADWLKELVLYRLSADHRIVYEPEDYCRQVYNKQNYHFIGKNHADRERMERIYKKLTENSQNDDIHNLIEDHMLSLYNIKKMLEKQDELAVGPLYGMVEYDCHGRRFRVKLSFKDEELGPIYE